MERESQYVKIVFKDGQVAAFGRIRGDLPTNALGGDWVTLDDALIQQSFSYLHPQAGPMAGSHYEWHVPDNPRSCTREMRVPVSEIKYIVLLDGEDHEIIKGVIEKIRNQESGPKQILPAMIVPGVPPRRHS